MNDKDKLKKKFETLCNKLTQTDRIFLLHLFEEVMETSYRRGVQQALYFEREESHRVIPTLKKDKNGSDASAKWRFNNLKRCIGIDGYVTTRAVRLVCEHEWMRVLATEE